MDDVTDVALDLALPTLLFCASAWLPVVNGLLGVADTVLVGTMATLVTASAEGWFGAGCEGRGGWAVGKGTA